jgi:hypothetical protein
MQQGHHQSAAGPITRCAPVLKEASPKSKFRASVRVGHSWPMSTRVKEWTVGRLPTEPWDLWAGGQFFGPHYPARR